VWTRNTVNPSGTFDTASWGLSWRSLLQVISFPGLKDLRLCRSAMPSLRVLNGQAGLLCAAQHLPRLMTAIDLGPSHRLIILIPAPEGWNLGSFSQSRCSGIGPSWLPRGSTVHRTLYHLRLGLLVVHVLSIR
jgi:hypothetical protein